jgi:hypothetical protein
MSRLPEPPNSFSIGVDPIDAAIHTTPTTKVMIAAGIVMMCRGMPAFPHPATSSPPSPGGRGF